MIASLKIVINCNHLFELYIILQKEFLIDNSIFRNEMLENISHIDVKLLSKSVTNVITYAITTEKYLFTLCLGIVIRE